MIQPVCLDTNILIWGIQNKASAGQEQMLERTRLFLKDLDESKAKVIIPSLVIGELLMKVPHDKHDAVLKHVSSRFMVASYDMAAASYFAKIWQDKKDDKQIQLMRDNGSITRAELKADYQIVAIAVSSGASCIYSYDKKLKQFADGHIAVKELPEMPQQMSLL